MSSAVTLSGTPWSCDQEEYVLRKVSHVARGSPSASQAGKTNRRRMLFGEIGFPDLVENTKDPASVCLACRCHCIRRWNVASGSGIRRILASGLRRSKLAFVDRLRDREAPSLLVHVPPALRKQLSPAESRENRQPDQGAGQQGKGRAKISDSACSPVNTHFGRTVRSAGRSTPRAGASWM